MKSKTSFFSKTLFFKNLKRFWPLWVVLTIFALLVPVYVGIQMGSGDIYGREALVLETKCLYYDIISKASPIVSMIIASAAAICVWEYLYSAKSAGGMHSYPLSRKTLFVTSYLSGLAMMLIPYVFGGGALIILMAVKGAGVPPCTWLLILSILCTSVFYFSCATLVAHITSHIVALPILYAMLMALEPIVVSLAGFIASGFLYGVNYRYWHKLDFLCPIYYMVTRVENVIDYSTRMELSNGYADVFDSKLVGFPIQIVYALAGLAITFGAYLIYKKRKNETAGDVLAIKALKPVIITILTFIGTACGTMILYFIFFDDDKYILVPFLLCMLVAITISYYCTNMIVEKKVNVFNKRTNIGFAAALAVGILACVIMSVDLFNVEKYIPDNSKFESVYVRIGNNTFDFETGKDDEAIEAVKKLHKVLSESEEEEVNGYIDGVACTSYGIYSTIDYIHGEEKTSRYYMPVIGKTIDSPSAKALYEFCSNPDILIHLFHTDDDLILNCIDVNIFAGEESEFYNMEGDNFTKFYDAILADVREGNYNPLDSMVSDKDGEIRVDFSYGNWEKNWYGDTYLEKEWLTVSVSLKMEHTLEALSEITGLSRERLEELLNWVDPQGKDDWKDYNYATEYYSSDYVVY